jgi:hypothetical protein
MTPGAQPEPSGIYFFHEFLRVLQLRHFLANHLSYPRRNRPYPLSQMVLALVCPIVDAAGDVFRRGALQGGSSFLSRLPGQSWPLRKAPGDRRR